MFCPDKNVIFRGWIFRWLKILKFHIFSYINHCIHDVQHHLIIIIDGLKSQMSNIFAHQIKNIDFWVWTQGSILDLVWSGERGRDHVIPTFWNFDQVTEKEAKGWGWDRGFGWEAADKIFARSKWLREFFMKLWWLLVWFHKKSASHPHSHT